LQLRDSEIGELLEDQGSANSEIMRGELRKRKKENEDELSRCIEKAEEARNFPTLMERRRKLLKEAKKRIKAQAADWRRRREID